MDSEQQRRKRKRMHKPHGNLLSLKSLTVCMSFLVFLFMVSSNRWLVRSDSFRPVLKVSTTLALMPSRLLSGDFSDTDRSLSPLVVEDRVLMPDHILLIVSNKINPTVQPVECVYYRLSNVSSEDEDGNKELERVVSRPVISVDEYHEYKSIVKCPLPPWNYSAVVALGQKGDATVEDERLLQIVGDQNVLLPTWTRLVYEAMLDWNTAVVFVKGFNLVPRRIADPTQFRCHFGLNNKFDRDGEFVITTEATAAAQEVIRCLLPRSIRNSSSADKAEGIRVTVSQTNVDDAPPLPSVAKIYNATRLYQQRRVNGGNKYELCACTMLWNQASFLREWIMYHAWLGVERWFIYDNNSDDQIHEVIDELNLENYNVSRHSWPWIKAQEAGFSHCALRARHECKWLAFFDVDEFYYFPERYSGRGQNSLRTLVANYTDSPTYAEIRTVCHSYGPSGLTSVPTQGVTVGYTCRLQAPERHKSIVRPELLDITLQNAVHHFKLREGYKPINLPESKVVVNHYKYQVWDTFKSKFFRRVSTYVTNWRENHNTGSKDRAPGLGTEPIEPPDWHLRFCEVWDTGLKDFILANFADPATGFLPWERSSTL